MFQGDILPWLLIEIGVELEHSHLKQQVTFQGEYL